MADVTFADIKVFAEKLDRLFDEHNLFATVYPMRGIQESYIAVEIEWGDWKHDHLRCKYMTEMFFDEIAIYDIVIESEVTADNGSDCYSAIHRIYVH